MQKKKQANYVSQMKRHDNRRGIVGQQLEKINPGEEERQWSGDLDTPKNPEHAW